jgi:hypothetical protein
MRLEVPPPADFESVLEVLREDAKH